MGRQVRRWTHPDLQRIKGVGVIELQASLDWLRAAQVVWNDVNLVGASVEEAFTNNGLTFRDFLDEFREVDEGGNLVPMK